MADRPKNRIAIPGRLSNPGIQGSGKIPGSRNTNPESKIGPAKEAGYKREQDENSVNKETMS
jgi:hypothetical protein